jgi:hypothetical protein
VYFGIGVVSFLQKISPGSPDINWHGSDGDDQEMADEDIGGRQAISG